MNEENTQEGLSLKDIFNMLKAHWIGILVCIILGAIGGGIIAISTPTMYEASIKIAIRDFGTEYSSLFKLLDMDFDMVVISHRFLREITNNTKASGVVRSIIDMIRNLDAEEICEGVSTQEQLEILKRMGCRRMQGQIIGDPAPYKEYIR